ncbi:Arylsulfotransferase domain-containing protein [Trichoderma chlorosporum]
MFFLPIICATALLFADPTLADAPLISNATDFRALADSDEGFPSQKFHSSDVIAPVFLVNKWEQDQVDNAPFIFLGTVYGENKAGPMIFDARDMSLVYADQKYENTYTSNAYLINNTRYFAFWEGVHTRGHANGNCLFFDENYNLKYNVTAQGLNDARADMHELSVTQSGTIIFSTYFNIPFDCRSVGGPENALLMDSGFQEVDPVTNELIFDWQASKFFTIDNSYASYNADYGTHDGNYLVSSRHLSILTLIDGKDGHPIWILGGRQNQFADLSNGEATNFSWQHDARIIPSSSNLTDETHITLFDNHGEYSGPCQDKCQTRALRIAVNQVLHTARVISQFFHPESIDSGAMGGYQTLNSGNVMTGWGYYPGFVEYKSDGTPVMDVQRGMIGGEPLPDMFAYRVSKGDWFGNPSWPPSLAADAPNNSTLDATVYVSWNGATEVTSWAIFASNDHSTINSYTNLIAESRRDGFETAIPLTSTNVTHRYVAAAAVSSSGDVLGSTVVIDLENEGKPAVVTSNIVTLKPSSSPPPSGSGNQSSTSTIGVMGGSIFGIAGIFYAGTYYLRRRARVGRGQREEGYRMVDLRD